MSFLNKPVNLWMQMILVFFAVILGPSFRLLDGMAIVRGSTEMSLITLAIMPFIFMGISIIPFGLIKKLKYGALNFVYLYFGTTLVLYFVGQMTSGIAQGAGIDQHSAANLGVAATVGVYMIVGLITMYYVAKWTNQYNQKFIDK